MQVNGSESAFHLPDRRGQRERRVSVISAGCIAMACAALTAVHAQINPSSAQNPFYGSVTVAPVTDAPLRLSLDDAIQMGLKNNLGLKEAEYAEHSIHAEQSQALQETSTPSRWWAIPVSTSTTWLPWDSDPA